MAFNALTVLGNWNAATNDRGLQAGRGTNGDAWKVNVSGGSRIGQNGIWQEGDIAFFSVDGWTRIPAVSDSYFNLLSTGAKNDASESITDQMGALLVAANGAEIKVQRGNYKVASKISRSAPVNIRGDGMGAGPGATTNTETSQLVAYFPNDYIFEISSIYGSAFSNLKFNVDPASRPQSAGGGIKLTAGASNTSANARIDNCAFVALWNCIEIVKPVYPVIENCYFEYWINNGIRLTTESGVEGSGGWISNNYFFGNFDADNAAGPCIYAESAYFTISHNLLLAAKYGVHFKPTANPAGSLRVFDNHIEEQEVAGIYCEKGDQVAAMAQFCRNEFSTVDHGDNEFIASIYIKADAGGAWLTDVQINENIFRNALTASAWFIDAQTGTDMHICGNILEGVGVNAGNGIRVGSQATNVLVSQNRITGTMGAKYSLTDQCTLVDTVNDLTYAEVNAITCKNGSMVWVVDGLAGSNPLAGSGSGTFAERIGGAWVAAASLRGANTFTAAQRISVGDTVAALLINGTTKGLRVMTGAGGTTLEGVDNTGVGSYQPLLLNGSTMQLQAAGTAVAELRSGAAYFQGVGTTASAANAFLDSGSTPGNQLLRSTSSARYKREVETLDPALADRVVKMARPVWYRSLAKNDPHIWSWYGLIAEELAEVDARLVHWGYAEDDREAIEIQPARTVKGLDEDGKEVNFKVSAQIEMRPKDGAAKVPDGVAYERLTVLLLDVARRQEERIAALEAASLLAKKYQ